VEFTLCRVQKIKKIKEENKMEQKRGQETKKQVKTLEILSLDDMSFIRGGDGDPPPVGNGDDKQG
jgi:sialic acid synthase SpsE